MCDWNINCFQFINAYVIEYIEVVKETTNHSDFVLYDKHHSNTTKKKKQYQYMRIAICKIAKRICEKNCKVRNM